MPIHRKHKRKSSRSGEAGFTLIEMVIVIVISSILGIFIFGVLTKCLVAQREMQVRKERSDDAIMTLERINREIREGVELKTTTVNYLIFRKRITSSADPDLWIKYYRDPATSILTRHSDEDMMDVIFSATGDVIARNVSFFKAGNNTSQKTKIDLIFTDGSDWTSYIFRRNIGL